MQKGLNDYKLQNQLKKQAAVSRTYVLIMLVCLWKKDNLTGSITSKILKQLDLILERYV